MNEVLANSHEARGVAPETLIDVISLRKEFKGGKEVLRGVDLQVPRERCWACWEKTAPVRRRC